MTALGTDPTKPSSSGAPPAPEPGTSPVPGPQPISARTRTMSPRAGAGSADPPDWRDRLGAVLLSVCAAGALVAAVSAITAVSDADSATRAVETWRLVGYSYFAGIFVLLALAPRQLRGMWELTIGAKLALPLAGATFLRGSTDAGAFVVVDGIVTVALIAAYVLMTGWTAPSAHRWTSAVAAHDARRRTAISSER